jgi:hypothetical protein
MSRTRLAQHPPSWSADLTHNLTDTMEHGGGYLQHVTQNQVAFSNSNLSPHTCGTHKSKVKVWQGRAPSEGSRKGPPFLPPAVLVWPEILAFLDLWPHHSNLCLQLQIALPYVSLSLILQGHQY